MVDDKKLEPWGYVNIYWQNGYDEVLIAYDEPTNANPALLTIQYSPSKLSYRYIPIRQLKEFYVTMYPTDVLGSGKED